MLEYGDDAIILDMGVMFPENEMLGVDLILPDPTYLQERKATIHGVFLTHGHEDHIGAMPFLLPLLGFPPIYGTKLTLGLVQPKLKEHKLLDKVERNTIEAGGKYPAGPFTIEPFHIAHSIPDAVAFGITTPAGLAVYLTDWKFDHTPVDNWPTDVAKMSELGRRNPILLLTDCVRAEYQRLYAQRARDRRRVRQYFRGGAGPHHRRLVRLEYIARADGDRHRRGLWPQGGAGGPLDGEQRAYRAGIGLPARARRAADPAQPDAGIQRRRARGGVHRQPGRADGRACAHGQPRLSARQDQAGRYGRGIGFADPGQRNLGA